MRLVHIWDWSAYFETGFIFPATQFPNTKKKRSIDSWKQRLGMRSMRQRGLGDNGVSIGVHCSTVHIELMWSIPTYFKLRKLVTYLIHFRAHFQWSTNANKGWSSFLLKDTISGPGGIWTGAWPVTLGSQDRCGHHYTTACLNTTLCFNIL